MRHHHAARATGVLAIVGLALAGCTAAGPSGGIGATETAPATTLAPQDVPAAASAGCGGAAPVAAGETQVDLTASRDENFYLRHVPPAHDGTTPVPLVLDLHGYAEGAAVHVQQSALGPFGEEHGFVTVTPQSGSGVPRWDTALGSTDLAFIGDVLDDAEQTMCIDENRVFVTGLSNGAFMTSAVACQYADRFAAAAPVAGIRDIDGCDPARPVPVIAFHGTNDPFVTYDGSLGPAAAALPAPDGSGRTLGEVGAVDPTAKGPTVPEITAAWAARNGCAPDPPAESTVTADVTLLAFACPAGAEVELYRVTDGGHSWPGSAFSKQIESVVGRTTDTISANELLWAFFVDHPRQPGADQPPS